MPAGVGAPASEGSSAPAPDLAHRWSPGRTAPVTRFAPRPDRVAAPVTRQPEVAARKGDWRGGSRVDSPEWRYRWGPGRGKRSARFDRAERFHVTPARPRRRRAGQYGEQRPGDFVEVARPLARDPPQDPGRTPTRRVSK
ncbi:hypothetical protein GCM10009634_60050 [Saccharothrix xinjiangensis]